MYTSRLLVENYLQRTLSENEIAALVVIIPAVQQWIDRQLSSTFNEVVETSRYFEGGEDSLDIDPCTAITAVTAVNDDLSLSYAFDLVTTPEVIFEPVNETVKREIRKRWGFFSRGINRIKVTAKFSEYDGGVPQDIEIAATRLAGGVLGAGKSAGQGENLAKEDLEGHGVWYNTDSSVIKTLADDDPILQGIIGGRKEVMIW